VWCSREHHSPSRYKSNKPRYVEFCSLLFTGYPVQKNRMRELTIYYMATMLSCCWVRTHSSQLTYRQTAWNDVWCPTKLRYAITYNVIWANQKNESFEYHWLHAHARFNVKSIPAILSGIGGHFKFCPYINWLHRWTVPQLSIMIIYNSTWSILIQ